MKTVLITGANRGLGLGFVKHFINQGYLVFACTRKIKSLSKRNIGLNNNLIPIKLDVTSDIQISLAVKKIKATTDHLDILINNAGVSKDTVVKENKKLVNNIESLDRSTMLKMFNINSVSPMMIIKSVLPLLSQSLNPFIINISSARASFNDEWDKIGYNTPNYGYRGSKSALSIMTHALTYEVSSHINVFSVDPGDVKTDMNSDGAQNITQTAKMIVDITNNLKKDLNGKLLKHTGDIYPI